MGHARGPIKFLPRAISALILFTAFSALTADESADYQIYLTKETVNDIPTPKAAADFDCTDRIYLVVEATDLPAGNHTLLVQWFNPAGEQQERTEYPFTAHPFTRIWAWLHLHAPAGTAIGRIFDPAFGMDEFIGVWHSRVAIDGDPVGEVRFNVLC